MIHKNLARGKVSHAIPLRGVMRGVKFNYSPTLTMIIDNFTDFARGKILFWSLGLFFLLYL